MGARLPGHIQGASHEGSDRVSSSIVRLLRLRRCGGPLLATKQGELQRILFPVFAHCYLDLVAPPEKEIDQDKAKNASRVLLDRFGDVRSCPPLSAAEV